MKSFLSFILFFFITNTFAQEQFAVYFNSDKFELTKAENKKLTDWMILHTKDKIVAINGYTDEDGSSSYNDTLAKKRVNNVFEIVKEKVPFREDFKSRSYGENFDQSKNKAENRKVTIYYIEEKDLAYENEILGIEMPKPEIIELVDDEVFLKDKSTNEKSLEEKLTKSKVGETIIIENINFYLNNEKLMNESMPILYDLLRVLQNQPKLVVEIQGHVCCNPNLEDKLSLKLSKKRAKTIMKFLISSGISKQRLSYNGFGSSKPIYKIPEKTHKEEVSNRRVEIMILEN
jgi:outer membrane protein OmpA-like peptidoglycan-associated protein